MTVLKLAVLALIIFAAFVVPDKSVSVNVNVAPKKPERPTPRRDTAKPREPHVLMGLNIVETPKRLMYVFNSAKGVRIENVEWRSTFGNLDGKTFYGRINRMNADGNVAQTLFSGVLQHDLIHVQIDHYGDYKIAIFQQGGYCNGIEYDFHYFGGSDITPIHQFIHHQIPCE